jgi:ribosomal protein L24E
MSIDDRAARLAERLLEDRARHASRPVAKIGGCFLCGRSYSPQLSSGDDSTRFCSAKCREAYDAGAMPAAELNPFTVDHWRVIAGQSPGYMPKPMRMRRHGFYIACLQCRREFESTGLRCCSTECERAYNGRAAAAATMAEVGDVLTEKRKCECCGGPIPNWIGKGVKRRRTPKSRRYCSDRCRNKANKTGAILTPERSEIASEPSEPFQPIFGPSSLPLNLVGGYRFPGAPDVDLGCAATAEEP